MGRVPVVVESSTTREVTPRERLEYWTELVSSYHCRMSSEPPSRGDFHGRTVRQRTDTYQLVGWRSDAMTYHRTPGHVRADSDDDYRLIMPTSGQLTMLQNDQEGRLRPGTACLATMDRPFVLTQGDHTRAFVLTIPRREVDHRLDTAVPLARELDFASGLGRVVGDLVVGLFTERATLTRYQFNAVSNRMVELLCMLVVGDDRPAVPGHLADVEAAVRRFVRERADDPHLNGAVVAQSLGWSLRQVQLALQQAGTTPRALIREERLQLAYQRLQSPAYRHWSVTDVALQFGFSSVSAFSSAFRRRFDLSPRDARQG
jgi:AraC-like DNA-binding protein